MSVSATVQNGKVVTSTTSTSATSSSSSSSSSKTASTSLDKDAFMQLLVAQMQYQDPLNPTDNTQYISQLATFSQLEATQNLQDTQTNSFASTLVGKHVILNVTDASGNASYVSGTVDYVTYENGTPYLSVSDKLYSVDKLDTVVTDDYYNASTLSQTFATMMAKLPTAANLTTSDSTSVKAARSYYDALTTYQKGFITSTDLTKLEALEKKLASLTGTDSTESTDSTT